MRLPIRVPKRGLTQPSPCARHISSSSGRARSWETIPRARTFIIYDLRNGGDPTRPHGVVEVKQHNGQIVHKGLKTTLFELQADRQKIQRMAPVIFLGRSAVT